MPRKSSNLKKKITLFNLINFFVLTMLAICMLLPFYMTLATSFASFEDIAGKSFVFFPKHFSTEAYRYIFATGLITKPFVISICITVLGVIYHLFITSLGAHVLASRTLPGKKILLTFVLITMFFGGGLIPFVLVVQTVGLLETYFSLVIPFSINTFNMLILRNFFRALPYDLTEASKIDGASEFRLFLQVIIPLSAPALSTIGLYYAVERWNDWYWPMIFISKIEMFPLALALRSLIINASSDMEVIGGYVPPDFLDSSAKRAAIVMVSIMPLILIYPLLQKYFIKGVLIGAIKE